ncbi:hypothetical protein V9T40_008005 [Parthenolecanium corni]|uniref:Uncharacterized protein n=1 Tax=Parthenolecanium corni TaxID=536013 RepID=A0AAN9TT55_9HEMI
MPNRKDARRWWHLAPKPKPKPKPVRVREYGDWRECERMSNFWHCERKGAKANWKFDRHHRAAEPIKTISAARESQVRANAYFTAARYRRWTAVDSTAVRQSVRQYGSMEYGQWTVDSGQWTLDTGSSGNVRPSFLFVGSCVAW